MVESRVTAVWFGFENTEGQGYITNFSKENFSLKF